MIPWCLQQKTYKIKLEWPPTPPKIKLSAIPQLTTPLLFIIDTGSSKEWIFDKNCLDCYVNYECYNQDDLNSRQQQSNKSEQVNYGIGSVIGVYRQIQLQKITSKILCVFKWININNLNANGVLGIPPLLKNTSIFRSIIELLKLNYKFSLFFNNFNSYLVVGGYEHDFIKPGATINKFKVDERGWILKVHELRIGKMISFNIHTIIDSGTQFIVLSKDLFDSYLTNLKEIEQDCYINSQQTITCPKLMTNRLSQIQIELENINGEIVNFILKTEDYVQITKNGFHIRISYFDAKNTLILGNLFMYRHYIMYDISSQQLWITQSNTNQIEKQIKRQLSLCFFLTIFLSCILVYFIQPFFIIPQ